MARGNEASLGRFEKSFAYLAWYFSAGSVLDVFHENQRREGEPGSFKASADVWIVTEALRRHIHERACHYWCRRTGRDPSYFPLSVDAVARLYFRIRKRRRDEIEQFDREVEEASQQGPDLFNSQEED